MKLELDYNIKDINTRLKEVEKICEEYKEDLNNYNLEQMANYLIFQMDKDERKKREILTPNRMKTVNKRETSFEGLVSKFENNKDGVYGLMHEDKNTILTPKTSITKKDVEEIPFLKQIAETIEELRKIPNRNYIVQQAIIELSQSQYIIKNAYRQPMSAKSPPMCPPNKAGIDWCKSLDIRNWETVAAILQNYPWLKEASTNKIETYMFWIIDDFERLTKKTLFEDHPMLYDIVLQKFEGEQNIDIRKNLKEKYGKTFSVEYISSLFNNKIPKLIAKMAEEEELIFNYTFVEKGAWKKCNRCGEVKLLHSMFYSKNSNNSKNGFYSICKKCRNSKKGAE